MKRHSKAILIALAALVSLVGIAFVSLNFFIGSAGTQTRVREALSRALGVPLTLTSAGLTPWGGLRIDGAGIPSERGNFLEPTSFRASYRWLPLLQKRLEIYDVEATAPRILWRQSADGAWAVPKRPAAPSSDAEKQPPREKKAPGFAVAIEGFKLQRGEITFIDKDDQPVAAFQAVDLDVRRLREEHLQGVLKVGQIRWGALLFADVNAPFSYADHALSFPELVAKWAGGTLRGSVDLEPEAVDLPFKSSLQLEQADLAQMAADGGWKSDQLAGKLSGNLDAHGAFRKFAKVEGRGRLAVENGQILQFDLLRTIGDVLRIPELADLHLRKAKAEYHLADERVYLEGLTLESPDVTITAKGPVRWDGKLELETRLAFSDKLTARLPDFVRTNFTTPDAQGQRGLEFRTTGSLAKMKTDLLERVIGGKLGEQFEDVLSSFLGPKKKKDDKKKEKKKKPDSASATPAPAAPVSPAPDVPPAGENP